MTTLKLRKFRMNNKGVSTIIAAALIVALTVILAVALGSTVLQIKTPQKQNQLEITGTASVSGNIILTNEGGDPINLADVKIETYISEGPYQGSSWAIPTSAYGYGYATSTGSSVWQAGDTLTITPFGSAFGPNPYYAEYAGYPGVLPYEGPTAGEPFTVTIYLNSQPVASTTIITQP